MPEENKEPQEGQEDLQFDKADFSEEQQQQAITCVVCQNELGGSYYRINHNTVCPMCKETLEEQQKRGTPVGRLFGAILFSIPAAVLGAVVYYGILALTGYEFGLIAILIGWGVGLAVRKGSNYRGGWAYQLLAVLMTYVAICSTYIPYIVQGMQQEEGRYINEISDADQLGLPAEQLSEKAGTIEAQNQSDEEYVNLLELLKTGSLTQKAIIYILLLIFSLAVPFMWGFQNIMGWIIIGIGLYQAWAMNKKMSMNVEGPFERTI